MSSTRMTRSNFVVAMSIVLRKKKLRQEFERIRLRRKTLRLIQMIRERA